MRVVEELNLIEKNFKRGLITEEEYERSKKSILLDALYNEITKNPVYMIVVSDDDGMEWCLLNTTDKKYAEKVYRDLCLPSYYTVELRATTDNPETYRSYTVIEID